MELKCVLMDQVVEGDIKSGVISFNNEQNIVPKVSCVESNRNENFGGNAFQIVICRYVTRSARGSHVIAVTEFQA
jgi:hypothetical protein